MTTQAQNRLHDRNGTHEGSPSSLRYTISEIAAHFGISLRTLRFYEDRGLLQPVRRGTARFYSSVDRSRLQMILKAKELGFTLSDIGGLIGGMSQTETSQDLPLRPEQILSQISLLERQRTGLDHAIGELRATHARLASADVSYHVA